MANETNEHRRTIQQQVDHLVAGMELARDILSPEGKILAGQGATISQHTISKLKQWGISHVYTVAEIPVHRITDPLAKSFIDTYTQSVESVKKAFDQAREEDEVPTDSFRAAADNLTGSLQAVGNSVDFLYDSSGAENELYRHSVNVSVIAALIAIWMKWPAETVSSVSLAGLMHDLGKTRLPAAWLQRMRKLSLDEQEEYKKHSQYGFELVRQIPDVSNSIAQGILQHHELLDGSGYPYGVKKEKIHPYAQIISVANLYDNAMMVQKEKDLFFSPYAGLEYLWKQVHRLPVDICMVFKDRMSDYLGGNQVMLTDGREGRVVFVDREIPWRSVVQLSDDLLVDLRTASDLCIHHVVR